MSQLEILNPFEYPQAIVHVDGDAFFASVEQTVHPELRGKPVVCGQERGIIAAASYEAKACGVKRGITLQEARTRCPQLVIRPTDYETCSLYSKRLFVIMRRFTPMVEEYSIDEGFADLTGLRRTYHGSYEKIALRMKETIERELGLTVSVGLSLTKVLAKLCSDFKKPSGFTAVPGTYIHKLLERLTLEEVWGIGRNTAALLRKQGVYTPLAFARQTEDFHRRLMGKVGVELWHELNGRQVYQVNAEAKETYQSIMKSKTFSPPSYEREFVFAQLVRNLESACIKARRHHLAARHVSILLRTQDFDHFVIGAKLTKATAHTAELTHILEQLYQEIFRDEVLYRATGVVLGELTPDDGLQLLLFEDRVKIERLEQLSHIVDQINNKFGKHKLHFATSLLANQQHHGYRDVVPIRKHDLLKGENRRQRLGLPLLGPS
jgi:DNA polymerase-4/DNA polymerase V